MASKLEQLSAMTTVVADTGDVSAIAASRPTDCTTNPTLILKAAALPGYAGLVADALEAGRWGASTREGKVAVACDRLAVLIGAEMAKLVPGRVSTEVDADLSFDTDATVAKARAIIAAYDGLGVARDRVLVKIAATWEGIRAAEVLQREGIDCNLTLLFSLAQAAACAEAGVFLVSPFVGRILDWHAKATGQSYTAETDPGVLSVRRIYGYYKQHGYGTVVMGASFRNLGEIEALAGCDRLTIAPALLDALAADHGDLPRRLSPDAPHAPHPKQAAGEAAFRWAINEDAMATEKLAEGIRQFARDLQALRATLDARLDEAA